MITLEALNAMHGDCLLLRYSYDEDKEALWVIDGGPGRSTWQDETLTVWKDVLLPRLFEISPARPVPVTLGMVSHIDDDHINGIEKIMNDLTAADPANPAKLKFERFWFNSFEKIVGHDGLPTTISANVQTPSLDKTVKGLIGDEDGQAVVESVGQGISLAADLRTLRLQGNSPFNGVIQAIKGHPTTAVKGGAAVTVIGPRKTRLDALQKDWEAALKEPGQAAREAAVASLFLPSSKLDKSVPNLSSIVVLVTIRDKTLLLCGDAQGGDVVDAWDELGLQAGPVEIDVLKMPHHGSRRNNPERFLKRFLAKNYVFSANGKYDNPDPQTIEAIISLNQGREFKMYFTHGDVTWANSYKTEFGEDAADLPTLLNVLKQQYGGGWSWEFREPAKTYISIAVE